MQQGILERAPKGGGDWASPLIIVWKPEGALKICGDFKVGVNYKIFSDSYPIPNMETPTGLLQWTHMPYGIKISLAIFEKALENVLLGKIENMIIYQNDICVGASSKKPKEF